jgi:signal transduction histidine kinase
LISDALNRLEKFVTNFLEFSRFESNEYKSAPLSFNLSTAVKKHMEAVKIEAEKKNIKMSFEIPDGMLTVVHADALQIDRVISNLLDNSIKYTNSNGTVTVKLSTEQRDPYSSHGHGIGIRGSLLAYLRSLLPGRQGF